MCDVYKLSSISWISLCVFFGLIVLGTVGMVGIGFVMDWDVENPTEPQQWIILLAAFSFVIGVFGIFPTLFVYFLCNAVIYKREKKRGDYYTQVIGAVLVLVTATIIVGILMF